MGKRDDKIQNIVNQTVTILHDEGAAAMSMRKVADRCGITLSNLQYYFADRDKLLEATIQFYFNAYEDELKTDLTLLKDTPPLVLIEHLLQKYLVCDLSNSSCVMFREFYSLASRNDSINRLVTRYYSAYCKKLIDIFTPFVPQASQVVELILPYIEGYSLMGHAMPSNREQIISSLMFIIQKMIDESAE